MDTVKTADLLPDIDSQISDHQEYERVIPQQPMLFVRNIVAEESEAIKMFDEPEPKTENV